MLIDVVTLYKKISSQDLTDQVNYWEDAHLSSKSSQNKEL